MTGVLYIIPYSKDMQSIPLFEMSHLYLHSLDKNIIILYFVLVYILIHINMFTLSIGFINIGADCTSTVERVK